MPKKLTTMGTIATPMPGIAPGRSHHSEEARRARRTTFGVNIMVSMTRKCATTGLPRIPNFTAQSQSTVALGATAEVFTGPLMNAYILVK